MGILADLIKYLGILTIGALIGYKFNISERVSNNLEKVQNFCLLFLLFTMGITIGMEDEVVNNLFSIGIKALILSVFTIVFSVIGVRVIKKYVYIEGDDNDN